MRDRKCKEKLKRIEEENKCIHFNFIDELSSQLLKDLTQWANENIFSIHGGQLICNTPYEESANARATSYPYKPFNPKIEINTGMVREIYRDAFTFPIVSQRIASETNNISFLNEQFNNASFTFSNGIPILKSQFQSKIFNSLVKEFSDHKDSRLSDNDYAVRFIMFEIMLAWVFFHELSHVVQCHYKLKGSENTEHKIEFYEIQTTNGDKTPQLRTQAREILADLEALDLTIKYMNREKIFCFESAYILLCAQACMFNRFSENYEESYSLITETHPHPVIRNEFIHNVFLKFMFYQLVNMDQNNNSEETKLNLIYMSTRAILLSSLFWENRYHKSNGEKLPSFLNLLSEELEKSRDEYTNQLTQGINDQLKFIVENHLMKVNFLDDLYKMNFFNGNQ